MAEEDEDNSNVQGNPDAWPNPQEPETPDKDAARGDPEAWPQEDDQNDAGPPPEAP